MKFIKEQYLENEKGAIYSFELDSAIYGELEKTALKYN